MNNILKYSLFMFVTIIFSNAVVELMTDSDLILIEKPLQTLGTSIVLSIIGGIFINWARKGSKDEN